MKESKEKEEEEEGEEAGLRGKGGGAQPSRTSQIAATIITEFNALSTNIMQMHLPPST